MFDTVSSIDLIEKLLKQVPENFPLRSMFYETYGDLLRCTSQEGAFAALEEAEKLYKAEHDYWGLANVLQSRGELLMLRGDYEGAFAAWEVAEKLYQALHDNLGLANIWQFLGYLQIQIGYYEGAFAALEEAKKLYEAEHYYCGGLANVLKYRGDLLQIKEDWSGACDYYVKALKIYRKEQDSMRICYTLSELQFCEKQIGKDSDAANHIRELNELLPNQPEPVQEYCKQKINGDNRN